VSWSHHAKIAFIGSHSVRKTNAVHAFAATIGRAGRSVEVGREVVRFNPLGLNERATPAASVAAGRGDIDGARSSSGVTGTGDRGDR
jgi:hypothetical protein